MDDQNKRDEMVQRFWDRVGGIIGVIPRRVIALLDLFELSASIVIANKEQDWADTIQTAVVDQGAVLYDEAVGRGFKRSKFEVFGRHMNDLRKFALLASEKCAIARVKDLVLERGIHSLISGPSEVPRVRRRTTITDASDMADASDEIKKPLLEQLARYYSINKDLGVKGDAFKDLLVTIESQEDEKLVVRVKCIECQQAPRCVRTGSTWAASNYFQHVRKVHIDKREAMRRRRSLRARPNQFGTPRIPRPGRNLNNRRRRVTAETQATSTPQVEENVETEERSADLPSDQPTDLPSEPQGCDGDEENRRTEQEKLTTPEQANDVSRSPPRDVSSLVNYFSGEGTSKDFRPTRKSNRSSDNSSTSEN